MPSTFLGLDYSMRELYKDSNGNEPSYPRYYRQAEKKLVKEQRRLSKMQKGSNNHEKQRLKLAKLHAKVAQENLLAKFVRGDLEEYPSFLVK